MGFNPDVKEIILTRLSSVLFTFTMLSQHITSVKGLFYLKAQDGRNRRVQRSLPKKGNKEEAIDVSLLSTKIIPHV